MQLLTQLGPDGGTAIIANPNVIIVSIVKDHDEYNPTFIVAIFLLSVSIFDPHLIYDKLIVTP
jgi:hypothetical protein